MRRVIKYAASKILENKLVYKTNNTANNKKIKDILFEEQRHYCAYTDECFTRTDAIDIDHFNPKLKGTELDGYNNWYLVKHQSNKEKSNKWDKFQPILHPTSADFEARVVYVDGDYFAANANDIEAVHLIGLLNLADPILAENRKRYIRRKIRDMEAYGEGASIYFSVLLEDDSCQVSYLRAIFEVFEIDIWKMLEVSPL